MSSKAKTGHSDRKGEETYLGSKQVQIIAIPADEMETLRKKVDELSQKIQHQAAVIAQAQEDSGSIKQSLSDKIDELVNLNELGDKRLQDRFREIARLSRIIQERDQALNEEHKKVEWLRRVAAVLARDYSKSFRARLISLAPTFLAIRRQKSLLKRKGLFDSKAYAAAYPDIVQSDIDPLRHYINHGLQEGRILRQKP